MTNRKLITKSSSKRVTADALGEAKRRNGWSNADLGDAMDCCEGSVRNRLDDEDPKNQMLVHELRRITQSDGPAVANCIFADLNFRLTATASQATALDALPLAAAKASLVGQLIEAAADNVIDRQEALSLLPQLVDLTNRLVGFKAHLRAIIDGDMPTS